jgi:3alpha(or 20beta)-hydroxysteroid dehydrogenase
MSIIEESGAVIQQGRQVAVARAPYDDRVWKRMENKVALITGAARGMGAAQARLFAAEGARVIVTDVLDDLGKQLADELGEAAAYTHLDVSSEEDWATTIHLASDAFGPVNVLAHCAGIARFGLIQDLTLRDYQEVIQVNLVGAFLGIKACIAPMTEAGGGSMVIISSIDGLAAHPAFSAYCSAKSGLSGLVRAAALELAPLGIRVNTICPGAIDTPMIRPDGVDPSVFAGLESQIPLGRVGGADELARAALFLASDDSRYVTGTNLTVDGGVMTQVPLTLG